MSLSSEDTFFLSNAPVHQCLQGLPWIENGRLFATEQKKTDRGIACHIENNFLKAEIWRVDASGNRHTWQGSNQRHQIIAGQRTDCHRRVWITHNVGPGGYRPGLGAAQALYSAAQQAGCE